MGKRAARDQNLAQFWAKTQKTPDLRSGILLTRGGFFGRGGFFTRITPDTENIIMRMLSKNIPVRLLPCEPSSKGAFTYFW